MRVRIAVSFELPPGADREEALAYVVDAVRTMKGSYRPDNWDGNNGEGDPMFYLDADTVRATTVTTKQNHRQILRAE